MKVGFSSSTGDMDAYLFWLDNNFTYRLSGGRPNLMNVFATPARQLTMIATSACTQDKWTVQRR